jgi:type IV pilus assembly protein PilY1
MVSSIRIQLYRRLIMKKLVPFTVALMIAAWFASPALAAFDSYPGDSSIYGVENSTKPNVLIIIDDSGSMSDNVIASDYDPAATYTVKNSCTNSPYDTSSNACTKNYVYQMTSSNHYQLVYGATSTTSQVWHDGYYTGWGWWQTWHPGYWETVTTYTYYPLTVAQVPTSCGASDDLDPYNTLTNDGIYTGYQLAAQGSSTATATCTESGSAGYTYVTGDYVNFTKASTTTYKQKIAVARDVVKNLIKTTQGVNFGLMTFLYKTVGWSNTGEGGTFLSKSITYGASSGTYETTIKGMDTVFPVGNSGNSSCINTTKCTNRDALRRAVDDLTHNDDTPLAETLLEAGRYFSGGTPLFGATIGVSSGNYTTPVTSSCQRNFVVFVTDGMSTADDNATALKSIGTNGDTDGDGKEPGDLSHSLDDVAKYLNTSTQNIISYFIGFNLSGADQDAIDLLTRAADTNHGKGKYYSSNSQVELATTLSEIMTEIYTVNSSYVAPVVPVSPQNRTYGSSRVYMGFFRPSVNAYWSGNLKKYGLDTNNYVLDQNGNFATWLDNNSNGLDDRDAVSLSTDAGASNGSFRSNAKSFWSSSVDAGTVKLGGTGEIIKGLTGSRHLYTYNGTNVNLTDSSNLLSAVSTTTLGVADATAKTSLVNFLQGRDAYDENANSNTTETRSWVMGDILHSRPLIINYDKYIFSTDNEKDSSLNKSMIFVGANDGMLHAFNDYDGSEAWAFVPPDTLGKLKDITGIYHPTFVDSSVSAYVYDTGNNGNLTETGDKVILMFGERRGGGTHDAPTNGNYYALDASDPAFPTFLWTLSNATTGFSELGESWSEPKFVKMKVKVGTVTKDRIVAFFGAGYDNPNEDGRYGATQSFPGTGAVPDSETGSGAVTSASSAAVSPKGRGVYAVELATLNSGVPTVDAAVTKIWGATNATNADMTFSFPAEITAVDTDNNGYTDRLYAVDTGGNLWRFEVGDTDPANWTAKRIFNANSTAVSTTDLGRKIFYKPSVVTENGYRMVFFGSGDREHPLNTNVVDRIYAFKDPDSNTTGTWPKTENDLVDVTTDALQDTLAANATALSSEISSVFSNLNSSSKYGWFIKLPSRTGYDPGEKVLASPTVFNKVLYVTTYAPVPTTGATSCTGNLGTARLYAVDYKTGEAVFNYDTGNGDIASQTTANSRAADSSGNTLTRSDRTIALGAGIPSGVVVLISAGGQTSIMAGVGGKIVLPPTKSGGSVIPLYWRQK